MRTAILLFILAFVFPSGAGAWPVVLYSDAEVVKRAELIVIARVKEGSIKKIAHEGSYEHQAVLLVTRAIKGKIPENELPITIRYGLLPVSARYVKDMNSKPTSPEEAGEATHIFEDNPSMGFNRSSTDVHKDQIWLLHRETFEGPAKDLGILRPEDIQPITKADRLKRLLKNP